MKKMMIVMALLVAMVAQAQVKIAPQLKKGMTMEYGLMSTTQFMTQELNISSGIKYEVLEETSDGYIIGTTVTEVETMGGDQLTNMMLNMTMQMLEGVTVRVKTDKEGKVVGIDNMAEVKSLGSEVLRKVLDEIYEKNPQIAQLMPKERLIQQSAEALTESDIVNSIVQTPTSAFVLNGKTIQNLMQEDYNNAQGIKMNRTFFVTNNGKTITTNSKSAMSNDDIKELIIKQVQKTAPDQLEMVKQNVDAIVASGMMKVDGTEKVVYQMQDNGWVKSSELVSDMDLLGQKFHLVSVMSLK